MSGLIEHTERSERSEKVKGGMAYLAYPIDQAKGNDDWAGRMSLIRQWLYQRDWGVYDPGAAWMVGRKQEPDRRVQSVNNMALGRADAVVAFLPPGVPSIGVPIEIERAAVNGIPTLIIGGHGSWALAKYSNYPWVRIGQEAEKVDDCLEWLLGMAGAAQTRHQRAAVLPFKQVRDPDPAEHGAKLPQRHYDGDAGFDLVVSRRTIVQPGSMADVACNVAVELPDWAWGLIVGRSSTLRTKGLQVHMGVVDSGYRGELFAAVSTLGDRPVEVVPGERLAQLIVVANQSRGLLPVMVDRLADSDRGVRGFGSSGR